MTTPYTTFFAILLLLFTGFSTRSIAAPYENGPKTEGDSLMQISPDGHLRCIIEADTFCETQTVQLSAFLQFLFTGVTQPVSVDWNTGENAHKITVSTSGTYTWNTTGFGCDHFNNTITLGTFFTGEIDIIGPPAFCPSTPVDLTVNTNNYNFPNFQWSPINFPDLTPVTITGPGTYSLTVLDEMGCPFSDQIFVPMSPPVVPVLQGPSVLCPENDTGYITITPNFASYQWDNGETTNPLLIEYPGFYEVTVTNEFGCTGSRFIGIQNGAAELFSILASQPAICPGDLDTLRVNGPFISYQWSTGANTFGIVVDTPGTYSITVTNLYGCTGVESITILPKTTPVIDILSPLVCPGDSATLTVTGGNFPSYLWSTGDTTVSITGLAGNTYSVTVSGNNLCPASDTATATLVNNLPLTAIAMPGPLDCYNPQISLDAGGSSSGPPYLINWSTQGGNFVSGQNTLQPVVNAAGLYILQIQDTLTLCVTADSVLVDANMNLPPAEAGPPGTITCLNGVLTLGPGTPPADTNLVYSWTSAGGGFLSGQNGPNPMINLPGTYTVVVTDTLNGCTSTDNVQIDQNTLAPVPMIAMPDTINCTVNTVQVDASGTSGANLVFLWSTNDGQLLSGANTPVATVGAPGTYQVLVTNPQNGCTAVDSVLVHTDANLPMAQATAGDTLDCLTMMLNLSGAGSSTGSDFEYSWSTVNGNIVSGSTTLNPLVDAPGTYTISVLNTTNNCQSLATVTVVQDIQPPVADAGPGDQITCANPTLTLDGSGSSAGPNFSYTWSTSGGNIVSGGTTLTPLVDEAGSYTLVVSNNANGCTSADQVQIGLSTTPPALQILPPDTLTCSTVSLQLDASGSAAGPNVQLVWNGVPGGITAGANTLQPTVELPGSYTLVLTDNTNGCADSLTVNVLQNTVLPSVEAGQPAPLTCILTQTQLGDPANPAGPQYQYQWATTGGNIVSGSNSPTPTVNQAGNYSVTITNLQNGCTGTDMLDLTADQVPPVAVAGPDSLLDCQQSSLTLQGSGSGGANLSYQWTTVGGNILSGAGTLTPTINAGGTYTLLVTNLQNGCTATDQLLITTSADVPVAIAGTPQTLTCTVVTLQLNGSSSSTGPEFTYAWSTTNGNIVSGPATLTPQIDAPGTYLLTVTNTTNNCTAVSSVVISENILAPQVDAGPNDTLTCSVTSLNLLAQASGSAPGNLTYSWSTLNGQILNGSNSPMPLIGAIGQYSLTVTDLSNGCTNTDAVTIIADLNTPVAAIAPPAVLNCLTPQLSLNAGGSSTGPSYTYTWTTIGGNFIGVPAGLQPALDQAGTYVLIVENLDNGCRDTSSVTVTQDITAPVAEAGTNRVLDCNNASLNLDGNGSSTGASFSYLWQSPGGQILSGNTTLTPLAGAPGWYFLTVTNAGNGCLSVDSVQVTQDILAPVLTAAPPTKLTCVVPQVNLQAGATGAGTAPSISWTTTTGNIVSGSGTLSPAVNMAGQYLLTVVNNQNGCSATLAVDVVEDRQPPSAQIGPAPLLTCSEQEVLLNATVSPATTLLWSTLDGQIISGSNSASLLVGAPGLYTLLVSSQTNGCTTSVQAPVLEETNIPTGLSFDLYPPSCTGSPGILTVEQVQGGVGPFSYSINGGLTFTSAEQFNSLDPGDYELVVRDDNGCTISEPVSVPEPVEPDVSLPPSFTIALGESLTLEAILPPGFPINVIDTVLWEPMDHLEFTGSSIPELLRPKAMPFRLTQYTVTIVTPEGCKATARTLVQVKQDVGIYVPNVIMPNDPDGNNAIFYIFADDIGVREIRSLQVYDRWGAQVFVNRNFQPNDPQYGWDGRVKGQEATPAVFGWWAEVELVNGETILIKGDVTVVH